MTDQQAVYFDHAKLDEPARGRWQHPAEDGQRVVCDLCPRNCKMAQKERGFCFVRENREGQVFSSTYGRSTGFCIDPIEKKPLHQFYPGSSVLSFGTPGCNLGCIFCQNWTMSRSRDLEAACQHALPDAIAEAACRHDCQSVAFTYNDPIVWAEYAIDTAHACHEKDIRTVAVTSGYISDIARADFFEPIDAANVDLKGFTDEFYKQYCGAHLQPVLDTLLWLVHESHTWVEMTNLLIPDANDSPGDIKRMCQWIASELGPEVPLHFSAFHPDFKLTGRQATPLGTLHAAYDIAVTAGLHYVYTGNVTDPARQHTYCPGCHRAVIRRSGYTIHSFDLCEGRCIHCQTPIAGHFGKCAGSWNGNRVPIDVES